MCVCVCVSWYRFGCFLCFPRSRLFLVNFVCGWICAPTGIRSMNFLSSDHIWESVCLCWACFVLHTNWMKWRRKLKALANNKDKIAITAQAGMTTAIIRVTKKEHRPKRTKYQIRKTKTKHNITTHTQQNRNNNNATLFKLIRIARGCC